MFFFCCFELGLGIDSWVTFSVEADLEVGGKIIVHFNFDEHLKNIEEIHILIDMYDILNFLISIETSIVLSITN